MNLAHERALWDIFPIDGQGRPTTYLSFSILKVLFSRAQRAYTPQELAELLAADHDEVRIICRQLQLAELIMKTGGEYESYKYNLKSRNIDVQAGFEKFLVDVEQEGLPADLISDYCPSVFV